jgi:hypothetical protein
MQPEIKREIVTLLARAVAHLYAIAGALASRRKWNADERAVELVRVLEMLTRAYERLAPRPDCAASVFEQYMVVRDVQASARDDVQAAMDLARAGLVLNTWCTAASMLVSAQATGQREKGNKKALLRGLCVLLWQTYSNPLTRWAATALSTETCT